MWGGGSVDSYRIYNFMMRLANGGIRPGAVAASDIVNIVEDKSLSDVGYWTTTVSVVDKTTALRFWAFDVTPKEELVSYEFRVPAGSVKQGFRFN